MIGTQLGWLCLYIVQMYTVLNKLENPLGADRSVLHHFQLKNPTVVMH